MSFKGLMLIAAIGLALYSFYQVKTNNPLSQDRLKRDTEETVVRGRYE